MVTEERGEKSTSAGCGKLFCRGVPVLSVQLLMSELSMQTPSECIPSQLSGASSELPHTGSDATFPLSQSPYSVPSSATANDALTVPLLSPLVLSSLSLTGEPAIPTPPPYFFFLRPHRHHAFLNHSMENRGFSSVSARGFTEYCIITAFHLLPLCLVFSQLRVRAQHFSLCKMQP